MQCKINKYAIDKYPLSVFSIDSASSAKSAIKKRTLEEIMMR